ncbi:MAG: metal-sensing transcriptional repressor [Candidatus Blackburnbacteria bacterium]|nr:metal-sensing transcriptional repressor [Candidatus Blackburnbacteria bacterium]
MGHLKKVVQMVQEDKYCVDIIHQSQAIQKALKEVDNLLLENHLKSCTVDNIKSGEDKKAIEEIVNIFKLSR